ncbi:MAG: hypothetical protein LAT61_06190 [Alcanivorax sp.]|nr:hypothetical protein [Alcanivorax sp.]
MFDQTDALWISLGLCLLVGWLVTFLPRKLSPFESKAAMTHLGSSTGILMFNIFPIISRGGIVNRDGDEISSILFFLATLIPVFLFVFIAFKAESEMKKNG